MCTVAVDAGRRQDKIPAALLTFLYSARGVHDIVWRQISFPVIKGTSGNCNAMPCISIHDRQNLHFQQETDKRRAGRSCFNSRLGTIRLSDTWPTPEHARGLWQSTELWSSFLQTRLIPFLVNYPSFNQPTHFSIESKWNERQANTPKVLFI